jgi:hypothetical protein
LVFIQGETVFETPHDEFNSSVFIKGTGKTLKGAFDLFFFEKNKHFYLKQKQLSSSLLIPCFSNIILTG